MIVRRWAQPDSAVLSQSEVNIAAEPVAGFLVFLFTEAYILTVRIMTARKENEIDSPAISRQVETRRIVEAPIKVYRTRF